MTSPSGIGARIGVHTGMASQLSATNQADFGMAVAVRPQTALVYDVHIPGCSDSSSESHSPEMPSTKASDRESRIIAEKQRRSQYNAQITQISALLTDIVHSQRKVDKTSVLRLAANKLRNEHVFGDSITCGHIETWSSSFVKYFDLFDGIMLAVTCRGRIFLVSPNVQEKLGYCHIDLLGQDLYNYVHYEDKDILNQHIYPPELRSGCSRRLLEEHHNFHIRIMRANAKSDPPRYEQCRVDGVLRRADRATTNAVQDEQTIRRQRVRHNRTFSSSGNDIVFIGMIHVQSNALPARILPPTAYTEYWTRHLIDGRIVQCDQSISLAAGYMTEEVTVVLADSDALRAVKLDPAVLEAQLTVHTREPVEVASSSTRSSQTKDVTQDSFEIMIKKQESALLSLTSTQFDLLMKFTETLRQQRHAIQKQLECAFCKNNGEPLTWYSAHSLKDSRGRVRCPVLRGYRCPLCGVSGDWAHTIKYCPDNITGLSSDPCKVQNYE
ncbi:protein cycle isoform X2 [Amyelois transitella]|uniref:protein cycle isoform X2 n=1 Tax=Amyelois transitella TaxID=680683 RepID=UPI00298FBBA6|nr:protein cycle isoform X2 [Amyelois transitella]